MDSGMPVTSAARPAPAGARPSASAPPTTVSRPMPADARSTVRSPLPVGRQLSPAQTRVLDLVAHPEQRSPHVAAASGLVIAGPRMFVVADDELFLGRFAATGDEAGAALVALPGSLPLDPKDRKKVKPDLESMTALPPSTRYPHGALLALPSASRSNRVTGWVWGFDAAGELAGMAHPLDVGPLVASLAAIVPGERNLEGAAVVGDRLVWADRATGPGTRNTLFSIPLATIDSLIARAPASPDGITASHVDLGSVSGVPLGLTDLATLGDGRLLFAAAAEGTDDSYNDGEIVGTAVGWIDPTGKIGMIHQLDTTGKVEGIAPLTTPQGEIVRRSDGSVPVRLVTDDDDPSRPARVLEVEIPLGAPGRW